MEATINLELPEVKDDDGNIIQNYRLVDLSTVCVVPYVNASSVYHGLMYIEGPSIVVYDSSGCNPIYYRNDFKIYSNRLKIEDNDEIVDKDEEIPNVTWSITYFTEDGIPVTSGQLTEDDRYKYQLLLNWMPKLDGKKLKPSSMFLTNADENDEVNLYPVVFATVRQGNDDISDLTLLWAQPIYLMQNQYGSSMLNSWDGEFKIDEKNGTILSSMIGAGRKTINNTFEGVLMGDVSGNIGSDAATGIGIYGYNDGVQSFRFGVDGNAFIGKSGRGRILIDGNHGAIGSASYCYNGRNLLQTNTVNDTGMLIDLDDGLIDIHGVSKDPTHGYIAGTGTRILLNAVPKTDFDAYFDISIPTEKGQRSLINIGKTEYYLQTKNYEYKSFITSDNSKFDPGTGMKINLADGTIDAYNFTLKSNNILLQDKSPYLVVKSVPNDNNQQRNLLYIGNNGYYLQTRNYSTGSSGLKIDLDNGYIDAYDFHLEAGGIELDSDGYLAINGDGYFYVGNSDNNYLKFDDGNLYLKSNNFYLSGSGMILNSGSTTPINVNSGVFTVGYDGTVTAKALIANVGGQIGGWIIGQNFLKSTSGSIELNSSGGGTIKVGKISLDGSTGTITSGTKNGTKYFNLNEDGLLTATGAVLDTLTVKTKADFKESCEITVDGHMTITGDTKATYALDLIGNTRVQGNLIMNNDSGVAGSIQANDSMILFHGASSDYGIYFHGGSAFSGNIKINDIDNLYVGDCTIKDYITENASSFIKVSNKNGNSVTLNSLIADLGKLAYEDDIKKNFDIKITASTGSELYRYDGSYVVEILEAKEEVRDKNGNVIGYNISTSVESIPTYTRINSVTVSKSTSATFGPGTSGTITFDLGGGSLSIS